MIESCAQIINKRRLGAKFDLAVAFGESLHKKLWQLTQDEKSLNRTTLTFVAEENNSEQLLKLPV